MFGGIVRLLVPPLLLAAMSLVASPAKAQSFGPTVNVSKTKADAWSFSNQLAVSGQNVYAVWDDGKGPLFSRSVNSGMTFSPGVAVSLGTVVAAKVGDDEHVYLAGSARARPQKPSQVYFRRSTNGGATFGSQIQVSTASVDGAFFDAMAVSGTNVYIVWRQWVGKWEVFFARSDDSGGQFKAPVKLSATSDFDTVSNINVVANGSNVHVAWSEDFGAGVQGIYYTRSTDGGDNFLSPPIKMSNDDTSANVFPALAVSGSWVYLAWMEHAACAQPSCQPGEAQNHIFFRRSDNSGASFFSVEDLTVSSPYGGAPQLAVSGSDDVHVIWYANSGVSYDVFYRGSHNNGGIFGSPLNVSTGYGAPDYSPTPAIAVNGADVYITWNGGASTTRDIYLRHSATSGNSFAAVDLSVATGGDSKNPKVIAAPGQVHVLWLDRTPGNWEVFYAHGTVPLP
jgi:hypothetical protein